MKLAGSVEVGPDQPMPPKVVGKGWAQLFRPSANIAWLVDQPVFLQWVNLPTDDPKEVPSMLELQIEKLSPLPVTQVVWGWEMVPGASKHGMGVLVVLVERSGIEAVLGRWERRGFDVDRVESPLLQRLVGTPFTEDGAYIFVSRAGGRRDWLVGWAKDGGLCCLSVVNVSDGDQAIRQLVAELNRMAWAGEVEGWGGSVEAVHLVGEAEDSDAWKAPLERELGVRVNVRSGPTEVELARASVARTVGGEARANLLPPEYGARYRQQFTDRLWMGGLMAVFGTYLIGVLIYFLVVEVQKFRQSRLADVIAVLNQSYTETLRLKAQAQVMQETMNLRYAALDCWLATVEAMPEELVLEKLAFSGGQSLQIEGTAPADQEGRITEYWQALQRKMVGSTNLFSEVQLRPTAQRTIQGVPMIQWSFNCRLRRPEI